ncbi:hypothetical protein GCM10010156_61630 [Planobispora rosea]|uniref:Uncharacterized protein n=1 Tax=Planobispora rosea TaxID=35762 RepID=A0A8J3S625_PLARO|nr:hypothetical protein GCM10010156_61630 [Planobispora rosea]GIH87464.1 hypothetical protein Pro02_58720 [Planobispora rosea]
MLDLAVRTAARDERPFLHMTEVHTGAIALWERVGKTRWIALPDHGRRKANRWHSVSTPRRIRISPKSTSEPGREMNGLPGSSRDPGGGGFSTDLC